MINFPLKKLLLFSFYSSRHQGQRSILTGTDDLCRIILFAGRGVAPSFLFDSAVRHQPLGCHFVGFASKTIQFHCFRDPGLVEVGHLCCDLPVHSKLSSPFCYLSYRIWTLHTFVSCVPTPQPHYGLPGHNLDPSMWCGCQHYWDETIS